MASQSLEAGDVTFVQSKSLWTIIAKLADEVIREQGLASVDKTMDADLYRFLHYLQEKVEGRGDD